MALGFLSGLAILGTAAQGQAPAGAGPVKNFTRKPGFRLPVKVDPREQPRLREVQLWVKNGPNEPWNLKESGPASQKDFAFRATQDGEYWFSVVTVDQTGKPNPANIAKEAPGLVVVVDTQPPLCEVRSLAATTGEILMHCEVRDANPDPTKTRLEYLAADKTWKPLELFANQLGVFHIPDSVVLKGPMRATVFDRAGNFSNQEINLAPMATEASAIPASLPAAETRSDKVALTSLPASLPTAPMNYTPPASLPVAVTARTAPPPLQLVNARHVALDYQIDPLGANNIGKVEVWLTADGGQTWQKLCEDLDRKSPVEFDLLGEDVFGVSLVVSGSNGHAAVIPARGDNPDWWVEVDCTRPTAQLLAVRPGTAKDELGTTLITWTAADKNLKPEPIDLYYATRPEGPWLPIARRLKNDGNFRWTVPPGLRGDIFVRLEVGDRAGNVTRCEAVQGGLVESPRPKARVLGIATTSYRPAAGEN